MATVEDEQFEQKAYSYPTFTAAFQRQQTYENMLCASEIQVEIYTSPVQLIYACFQTILFLATIIGSLLAIIELSKKTTIPDSTRVLLVGSLFFANAHELAYFSSPLKVFQMSLFHSNSSCYPLASTLECIPTTTVLSMGISGNMLIQSALSVDRCRFDVQQRYLTSETLKTTQTICYLSIAQFLAMFLYSGGVLLMRKNQKNIPPIVYTNVIVWVYAPPYACVSLAPLILYSLWNLKKQRQIRIQSITVQKETQDDHMRKLQISWG
ncbi:hypothetical protein GCK72_005859 [Caenorhabditis remanei]|uniref:Uncharacterized protein n=1 Tax=Caenorhabditis remanei TaxID=31234 RepID=A0A6A5HGQ3_CAERE|nr:hypothetical protein GCK72_005859 [Caenorhabditis remanei]KAF1765906.1 hypothetical protein GCK72_005859 [Caenorhabditis remanei]